VGGDGYPAAQVGDDEIEIGVPAPQVLSGAVGHRLVVERVKDADAGQLGQPGQPGDGLELVHHHRIDDECRRAAPLRQLMGQDAAEVGGVLAHLALAQVFEHRFGHGVGPSLDGAQKPAAADDGLQGIERDGFSREEIQNRLEPEGVLVRDGGILADHVLVVAEGLGAAQGPTLKHRNLGRGGAGIDRQYPLVCFRHHIAPTGTIYL